MTGAISWTFSLAILACFLTFALRLFFRKSFTGYLSVFAWLFTLSGLSFSAIDLAVKIGHFAGNQLARSQNALLGIFEFSYLAILFFCFISEPSGKKMRTLLRLPLIGGLLGWYLDSKGMAIALAVVGVVALYASWKNKESHKFVWRAQLKAALPIAALSVYALPTNLWFAGYFLWALIFKMAVANTAVVKNMMLDYDKKPSNIA